ncbi:hypothetical protein [Sphingopyxis panaciterrae]
MIDAPPALPPSQEQVIEQRLIECGLEVAGISVRYEDYLRSIEIMIRSTAGATTDHFECIRAAAGYEIVGFENRQMDQAYNDYISELARPQLLQSFKGRLQQRGLLEGFPERRNFENLAAYAKALEMHGGIAPGSALRSSGDGILFSPPRDEKNPGDLVDRYSDLMAIIGYASALEDVKFGFVGNEAAPDK